MERCIITTAGEMRAIEKQSMRELESLIGADMIDTVSFRSAIRVGVRVPPVHEGEPSPRGDLILSIPAGSVMLVDDQSHSKPLPVNQIATAAYRAKCYPNQPTHMIRGDVAIVPDEDFA